MSDQRHYTEHSPKVQQLAEVLRTEWLSQASIRSGKQIRLSRSTQWQIAFIKAAKFCLNLDIDPTRLVSTTLEVHASRDAVYPSMLMDPAVVAVLNAVTAEDSDGGAHIRITAIEAMYRSEWSKIMALRRNGVSKVAILDNSYSLRPLVLWVFAGRAGMDQTRFYIDAVAEFRMNRPEAEKVFGDIVKGLR